MFMTKTKSRNENAVDFRQVTRAQLLEMLERQNKILNNRRFIDGLPDKGEKVKQLHKQIVLELEKHNKVEQLCQDMASINIGIDNLDTLEWTGKHAPYSMQCNNQSDVEDGNILKMFVSHSGVNQDKTVVKEKSEEPLIKTTDLIDNYPIVTEKSQNVEFQEFNDNVEVYAKNLCGRIDTRPLNERKHLFLNKPIKPNKHSEVKSASLSLKESVTLQIIQENKYKEIKAEHLKERSFLKFNTKNYRDTKPAVDFEDIEDVSDEDASIILSDIENY